MEEEIKQFLDRFSFKNSERKARQLVAEHFNGQVISNRYVKIDGKEYRIKKNLWTLEWEITHMKWEHGNNFRYSKPY